MKKIDGIELLRMYRDREISHNTKIKSISATGNIYYMEVSHGADKIVYQDGSAVSTGYLTNTLNSFEIIEEKPKKIEYVQHSSNDSKNVEKIKNKIDELVDVANYLLAKESDK